MSENIFLFVPNIIGYARIVLALFSFYYMPFDVVRATVCYLTSALLDAFDGYAARYFNQSTKFGGMLDQLTDRCATMCLLVVLAHFYPKYMFWFQLSMIVDIASHWLYLQTTTMQGKTSHKFVDLSSNPVLRVYYSSRPVLFSMCAGNELFYAALYLLYFAEGPLGLSLQISIKYRFKLFLSILVLNVGAFRWIVGLCAPIAFLKAIISIVHLIAASINLGTIDVNERLEAAKKQ